ncbi:hypothetical protein NQ317_015563 [Molorchus minor]|uniref:histone deacetylase n=1 Tax=Molorchus minor TaxID=1323400 RepID=A0ABQ9IQN7_9CUCU|nr:hypothetical protein NQ317_015563 [Molorchus minor]
MADAHCGYCFINNVAIAAEMALTEGYAKKVLICSLFLYTRYEHGLFWPHLRESNCDYIGVGAGKGYNVNVPLNIINLGDNDYLGIMFNLLLPIAYEYNPDLILISAGYDAAIGCPEGQMVVTPQCYGHLISLLSGLANGKIVACLEGGYFIESLAEGVAFTVKALLGNVCYPLIQPTIPKLHEVVDEVINNVKYFLHKSDEHVSCIDYVPVSEIETNYPVPSEEEFNSNMNIIHKYTQNGRKCNDIVGYIYDEELLNHKPTSDSGKAVPERPERLTEIIKQFEEFHILERSKKNRQCQPIFKWCILRNTSSRIMAHESLKERPDWYFNEHTGECVSRSVNCVLSLARTIADDKIRAGVSVVRPPGHHASANRGSGFCFVNNVVIAANYLIMEKGYKKVLIVDFDIHHGNGTQDLTYNRRDIMYISVHRVQKRILIIGRYGTGLFPPIAFTYDPDFVLISAEFDAGIYDPLGGGYKVSCQ